MASPARPPRDSSSDRKWKLVRRVVFVFLRILFFRSQIFLTAFLILEEKHTRTPAGRWEKAKGGKGGRLRVQILDYKCILHLRLPWFWRSAKSSKLNAVATSPAGSGVESYLSALTWGSLKAARPLLISLKNTLYQLTLIKFCENSDVVLFHWTYSYSFLLRDRIYPKVVEVAEFMLYVLTLCSNTL